MGVCVCDGNCLEKLGICYIEKSRISTVRAIMSSCKNVDYLNIIKNLAFNCPDTAAINHDNLAEATLSHFQCFLMGTV